MKKIDFDFDNNNVSTNINYNSNDDDDDDDDEDSIETLLFDEEDDIHVQELSTIPRTTSTSTTTYQLNEQQIQMSLEQIICDGILFDFFIFFSDTSYLNIKI